MIHPRLPENYTVAQVGKRWYPLQIERYYSIHSPEGQVLFCACHGSNGALHYSTRKEAVEYCFSADHVDREWQEQQWKRFAVKSDVYPERCSHYQDIIEVTTGFSPLVHTFSSEISVFVPSYWCGDGQYHHSIIITDAICIEDALEEAANKAYTAYAACDCSTLPAMIAG